MLKKGLHVLKSSGEDGHINHSTNKWMDVNTIKGAYGGSNRKIKESMRTDPRRPLGQCGLSWAPWPLAGVYRREEALRGRTGQNAMCLWPVKLPGGLEGRSPEEGRG